MTAAWDPPAWFGCTEAGVSAALHVLLSLAGVSAHARQWTSYSRLTLVRIKRCLLMVHATPAIAAKMGDAVVAGKPLPETES